MAHNKPISEKGFYGFWVLVLVGILCQSTTSAFQIPIAPNNKLHQPIPNNESSISEILQKSKGHSFKGQFLNEGSQVYIKQQKTSFNVITVNEGQAYLSVQQAKSLNTFLYAPQSFISILSNSLDSLNFEDNQLKESQQGIMPMDSKPLEIHLEFYNPKWISETVLYCRFLFNATAFATNISQTDQYCTQQSPTSWNCSNTKVTYYSTYRNRQNKTSPSPTILVSYSISVTQLSNQQIQYQFSMIGDQGVFVHLSSKLPFVQSHNYLNMFSYIAFMGTILILQLISASKLSKKINALGNGQRYSLLGFAFAVIWDLYIGIFFAYNTFYLDNILYKICFGAITVGYAVLYICYDVSMMTKILIALIHSRNWPQQQQLRNGKKLILIFYLLFFLFYEGIVFIDQFLGFQWWTCLIITSFIMFPQIIHNIHKGYGGEGLNIPLIVFMVSRYAVFMYQKGCPENVYGMKPYPYVALGLGVGVVLQVSLLVSQSIFGSRFFIPVKWRPGYFDYSHKMSLSEVKGIECTICLQHLQDEDDVTTTKLEEDDVQQHKQNQVTSIITEQDQPNFSKKLLRKVTVFRTPCKHLFHPQCLKSWLGVKLQCPSCRTPLPSL